MALCDGAGGEVSCGCACSWDFQLSLGGFSFGTYFVLLGGGGNAWGCFDWVVILMLTARWE